MKCFTIEGKMVSPGIKVHRDPFSRIECGNTGRGRKLGYVGLKVADFEQGIKQVEVCSVRKTEKGYWQLTNESLGDSENILVAVAIPGGFRGAAIFYSSEKEKVPCEKRNLCLYGSNSCPKCGAIGEVLPTDPEAFHHPNSGEVEKHKAWGRIPGVIEIASGHDAEGDAGRMGGTHEEKILILSPGARFLVKRSGRLYGESSVIHVRYDGLDSGLMVGTQEQVYPEDYTT